jgi:hypothetical protein
MSLTTEEFFGFYLNRNKYLNNENTRQISIYKLIYYYFIETKSLLGVDLFVIDFRCIPRHRCCPMRKYLNHEYDLNNLTCRCVRLYSIRSRDLTGIKGKFKSILHEILITGCYYTISVQLCSEKTRVYTKRESICSFSFTYYRYNFNYQISLTQIRE